MTQMNAVSCLYFGPGARMQTAQLSIPAAVTASLIMLTHIAQAPDRVYSNQYLLGKEGDSVSAICKVTCCGCFSLLCLYLQGFKRQNDFCKRAAAITWPYQHLEVVHHSLGDL